GSGMPAFVRRENPDQSFWQESSPPQTGYLALLTPGGEVIAVLQARDLEPLVVISAWAEVKFLLEVALDVVLILDGLMLVRLAASAATRAALAIFGRQLAERALVAGDREVLEAAGEMVGKDATLQASPPPMPR